jgi:hypothetical protein
LANPNWRRDVGWLARFLSLERAGASSADIGLYDQAIAAVRRYPRCHSGPVNPAEAWDEVLQPIDEILIRRQERHIARVRRAQSNPHADPGPEG